MEKGIMYFLGVGAVIYVLVVGMYVTQHSASVLAAPVVITTDETLLTSEVYMDVNQDITMRFPKDWEIDRDAAANSGVLLISRSGKGSEALRIIKITKENLPFSEAKIINGNPSDFLYFMKSAKIASSTLITLHGKPARLLEATLDVKGIYYRELAVFIIKDGYPFIISGMARDSLWSVYKNEILAALLSFEMN
jgi:hypothetical protein